MASMATRREVLDDVFREAGVELRKIDLSEKCADCDGIRQDGSTWYRASCIAPDGSEITLGFCGMLHMVCWLELHQFDNDPERLTLAD